MLARKVVPILNVSDIRESFAWFEKLGWEKAWEWGDPPGFGGVCSGACEIFLCEGGQGSRSKRPLAPMSGFDDRERPDSGVWMSVFVGDVDAVYRRCVEQGIEVTFPPTDMEWNVREAHVRHPDGHIFRIGTSTEEEE